MISSGRGRRNRAFWLTGRRLHAIAALGAVLWTAGIALHPLAIHTGSIILPALASHHMYSLVCHQMPDRSFHLWHAPLSVCARCTAIYAAFTIVLVGMLVPPLRRLLGRRPLAGLLLLLPMLADAALDATGLHAATIATRTITGALAGAGLALVIARALEDVRLEFLPPTISGIEERSTS